MNIRNSFRTPAIALALGTSVYSVRAGAQDAPGTRLGAVDLRLAYSNLKETIDTDQQLQAMQDQFTKMTAEHQKQMQAMQKKITDAVKTGGPYEELQSEMDSKTMQDALQEQTLKLHIQRMQNQQLKHGFEQLQAAVSDLAKQKGLDAVMVKSGVIPTPYNTETANPDVIGNMVFNRSTLYLSDPVDLTADAIALVNKSYKTAVPVNGQMTGTVPGPVTPMQIGSKTYTLEIAGDEASREKGLMERDSNPADHGMIFVFEMPEEQSFWMHHTRFPLDILFVDAHGKIVSIHTMKPYDETPIPSNGAAKYAIELPGGQARTTGVKPGDVLKIPVAVDQALKIEPTSQTDPVKK